MDDTATAGDTISLIKLPLGRERLAEIRRRVEAYSSLEVLAESWPGMARDLLAEVDRLTQARLVQRAEALLEAAELMDRLGWSQAAEMLEAQVTLEAADRRPYTPGSRLMRHRVLSGLALALAQQPAQELADATEDSRVTG
ncbi:hypothetical protein [Streptacidiphilus sp. EB103A]|uniref:hypothetical protein n=1 Tax=Streptacidiphilus sp. EB103A TaxID=3156275 RepID=UPI00351771F6